MTDSRDALFYFHNIIKKMHKIADRELVPLGIAHSEMRILIIIYEDENSSQDDMASRLTVDRSNVGRALTKLENAGYIRRMKDQRDGRAKKIRLTEKGKDIREKILKIKNDIENAFISGITPEESGILIDILKKVDKSLKP